MIEYTEFREKLLDHLNEQIDFYASKAFNDNLVGKLVEGDSVTITFTIRLDFEQ